MHVIITLQLQFLCNSNPLDATVKYMLYTNTHYSISNGQGLNLQVTY